MYEDRERAVTIKNPLKNTPLQCVTLEICSAVRDHKQRCQSANALMFVIESTIFYFTQIFFFFLSLCAYIIKTFDQNWDMSLS